MTQGQQEEDGGRNDPLAQASFGESGGLGIKILGVGGAGTNAVDRIKLEDLEQVHLAAMDTDQQVLLASPVEETFLLGSKVTHGKSCGGAVERGRAAAEADAAELGNHFRGVDLLFLLCGLGGGTGSGAAPVIARQAREQGAVVVAFATLPFEREGKVRQKRAQEALKELRGETNALITLPNDLIFREVDESATLMEAFATADKWIHLGVQAIWSMLFHTGLINVDFSAMREALSEPGRRTLFGTGYGNGDDAVEQAVQELENCPLLQKPESGLSDETDQLILNLTGGPDLTMGTVNRVLDLVAEKFGCRQSVVLGAFVDGSFYHQLRITLLGTMSSPGHVLRAQRPQPAAGIPANLPPEEPEEQRAADLSRAGEGNGTEGCTEPVKEEPERQAAVAQGLRKRTQEEFAFPTEMEERGLFEKTPHNLYEGEDLDVPTYLRRGIRIARN